ncbi:ABC transporter permease [Pseudothermotoga thermarum]|uniref:ABC-2 type transporter n=1 Tax=Pseudothermotoga thermarum DSM 5069 TaxID=688269 RepID=F7YVE8_9THEM|nr:ABC transporter permease [Pseudothermotoga thermarum]AEH50451.1 ABC-2 type transporter [Pseudothermotoga thermarum DSM 5069]
MKIFKFAKAIFLNETREFNGIFWSFIFPLILFFILVSVFSGMYSENPSSINFRLGLVWNESPAGFGKILDEVLAQLNPEPFSINRFQSIEEAIDALKKGKIDCILNVPSGFNAAMFRALFAQSPAKVELYKISNTFESSLATQILENVLQQIDLEMGRQSFARLNRPYEEFVIQSIPVQRQASKFNYNNYIFPGIILMAILSIGIFNLSLNLIYNRTEGVNKRIYTTPTNGLQYFFSMILSFTFMMIISAVLVYSVGLTIFKVDKSVLSLDFIVRLIFSMLVSLSFGMMIASFFKKFSTAMVFCQISYQLLMFLGGLYFPVLNFGMPKIMNYIALSLPTTYLVENLRTVIGQSPYNFSSIQLWGVPAIWLIAGLVVFLLNFRKVMSYE